MLNPAINKLKSLLSARPSLAALLGYAGLSLVMTFPMIFYLDRMPFTGTARIPPGADPFLCLWEMWWFKYAATNGVSPFFTDFMFYPNGVSLYFTFIMILYAVISFPFQYFLGLIEIYNLLFLFSLVMSGLGTYFLVRYLVKCSMPAFISGCVYAFSPFIFAHISHITIFSAYPWIPYFVLFFIRLYRDHTWINAVFAALFLVAATLSDLNYSVFTAVFIVCFILYHFIYDRSGLLEKGFVKRFILFNVLFAIFISPYAIPLVQLYFKASFTVSLPIQASISQSADILSFFMPSFMHPIFGSYLKPIYAHIGMFGGTKVSGNTELVAYIGFSVIFITAYALKRYPFRHIRFWVFISIFFGILCLGPALKFYGLVTFRTPQFGLDALAARIEPDLHPVALGMLKDQIGIPLPYLIWHFVPILGGNESATRMFVFFILGISIIGGYGTRALLERYSKKRIWCLQGHHLIFSVLLIAILFEYLPTPLKMMPVPVPKVYAEIKKDKEDFCVVDLPLFYIPDPKDPFYIRTQKETYYKYYNIYSGLSLYYQTVHGKKILGGMLGRFPNDMINYVEENTFLKLLAYPETITVPSSNLSVADTRKDRLKYIVIHKTHLSDLDLMRIRLFLDGQFSKPYSEDELTVVYKTY